MDQHLIILHLFQTLCYRRDCCIVSERFINTHEATKLQRTINGRKFSGILKHNATYCERKIKLIKQVISDMTRMIELCF